MYRAEAVYVTIPPQPTPPHPPSQLLITARVEETLQQQQNLEGVSLNSAAVARAAKAMKV